MNPLQNLRRNISITTLIIIHTTCITLCSSQSSAALNDNSTTLDLQLTTTTINDNMETIDIPYYWLIMMIASGVIGAILIPIVFVHTFYNFCKREITGTLSRILYTIFFLSYWLQCIGYGFLRTDIIVPMGTLINCKYGFFLCTNCVFVGKLTLFIIFLVRIDLAFHSSALGYPRKCLGALMTSYVIITCVLNAFYMFVTWDLVEFVHLPDFFQTNAVNVSNGICSAGHNATAQWRMVLAALGLFDLIFSVIMVSLFVYKLNIVIKMSKNDNGGDSRVGRTRSERDREGQLSQVMRKQTVLVSFAISTSAAFLIVGAIYTPFSYQAPLDAIANVLSVWLMFNFADPIWNCCVKYCCVCCYCCIEREQFIMGMRRMTTFRSGTGDSSIRSSLSTPLPNAPPEARAPVVLTTIAERKNEEEPPIEIKFDNNWNSKDLPRSSRSQQAGNTNDSEKTQNGKVESNLSSVSNKNRLKARVPVPSTSPSDFGSPPIMSFKQESNDMDMQYKLHQEEEEATAGPDGQRLETAERENNANTNGNTSSTSNSSSMDHNRDEVVIVYDDDAPKMKLHLDVNSQSESSRPTISNNGNNNHVVYERANTQTKSVMSSAVTASSDTPTPEPEDIAIDMDDIPKYEAINMSNLSSNSLPPTVDKMKSESLSTAGLVYHDSSNSTRL